MAEGVANAERQPAGKFRGVRCAEACGQVLQGREALVRRAPYGYLCHRGRGLSRFASVAMSATI